MLFDDFLGQLQHLFRGAGIQGGGVFVQKQQLGGYQGGHQQRQRLALSAGEEAHRVLHPVLQTKPQLAKPLPEVLPVLFGDHGEGTALVGSPQVGQGQIFLDGHVGGGTLQGVLEHPADEFTALVVRQTGDVLAVENDGAGVGGEGAGDGAKKGTFARAVGTQHGNKVAGFQMEGNVSQGRLFVDGTDAEGFGDVTEL